MSSTSNLISKFTEDGLDDVQAGVLISAMGKDSACMVEAFVDLRAHDLLLRELDPARSDEVFIANLDAAIDFGLDGFDGDGGIDATDGSGGPDDGGGGIDGLDGGLPGGDGGSSLIGESVDPSSLLDPTSLVDPSVVGNVVTSAQGASGAAAGGSAAAGSAAAGSAAAGSVASGGAMAWVVGSVVAVAVGTTTVVVTQSDVAPPPIVVPQEIVVTELPVSADTFYSTQVKRRSLIAGDQDRLAVDLFKKTLLKFDYPDGAPKLLNPRVRLYCTEAKGEFTIAVQRTGANWEEEKLNWRNKPQATSGPLAEVTPEAGSFLEIPLPPEVLAAWSPDTPLSLQLSKVVNNKNKYHSATFASKEHENPDWHPRLILEVEE